MLNGISPSDCSPMKSEPKQTMVQDGCETRVTPFKHANPIIDLNKENTSEENAYNNLTEV